MKRCFCVELLKSAGFHTAGANGLFALAISVATPENSPYLYRLKSRTFDKILVQVSVRQQKRLGV